MSKARWFVVAYPKQGVYSTFGPFVSSQEAWCEVRRLLRDASWDRAWVVAR